MNEQDELIQHIKKWVMLEKSMTNLRKELKEKRNEKKETSNKLIEIMRENDIDCFNINDGKLLYTRRKVKKPLSKKHLIASLVSYFGGNDKSANTLSEFILNSRGEKVIENIRIKK